MIWLWTNKNSERDSRSFFNKKGKRSFTFTDRKELHKPYDEKVIGLFYDERKHVFLFRMRKAH